MNKVLEYLKACGTFYLATSENGQPHVRPFGAVCKFDDKLYIITSNQKKVYQQLKNNAKVEICGESEDDWIRVEGEMQEDTRREARVAMLEANPGLRRRVNPKFCVNSIWGANRAKFIQGGSRGIRLLPC